MEGPNFRGQISDSNKYYILSSQGAGGRLLSNLGGNGSNEVDTLNIDITEFL
jgi:hypothetical protein